MARILFAVMEPQAVSEVAKYFAEAGHQVSVTKDAEKAYSGIVTNPPDILVATVFVPPMDCFELRDAAAEANPGGTSALLLTALGSDGRPMKAWKHDFEAYCISKEFWQIVLCIEQLLEYELRPRPGVE